MTTLLEPAVKLADGTYRPECVETVVRQAVRDRDPMIWVGKGESSQGVHLQVEPVAARQRETAVGFIDGGATVQLSSEETAAGERGPVMTTGPVVVNIFGIEEGDDLTASEARALAAALVEAADELDRIGT